MRNVTVALVVMIAALSGGCGVWTSHQNVAVEPADRALRWGEPDNGLRLGIEAKQDTEHESDGLVLEDCTIFVRFGVVPGQVPELASHVPELASADDDTHAHGDDGATWILVSRRNWVDSRGAEVTLTFDDGTTYTLPRGNDGEDDDSRPLGICNVPDNAWTEVLTLTGWGEDLKSPTNATLRVTYHLDPDPARPHQWSGTIQTPPVRVKFYRMKSWSLMG
jgi:hypothetical protein